MHESEVRSVIESARLLRTQGRHEAGREELQRAAQTGAIEAMIELAHWAREEGRTSESNRWIELAEGLVRPDDLDALTTLSGAFALALGPGTREEQQRRSLYYLEKVAAAGNTTAQENVALQYLHGLNGCPKDENQFLRWIQEAVSGGSERAAYIYAEYLHKLGRKVPNRVLAMVAASRARNRSADRLLRAISGGAKRGR